MDILSQAEIDEIIQVSLLIRKYKESINNKANQHTEGAGFSWLNVAKEMMDFTAGRQVSCTVAREITRGLFSILGNRK